MGSTLVIAELQDGKVKKTTFSAITFAKQVGAPFAILAVGAGAGAAAAPAPIASTSNSPPTCRANVIALSVVLRTLPS